MIPVWNVYLFQRGHKDEQTSDKPWSWLKLMTLLHTQEKGSFLLPNRRQHSFRSDIAFSVGKHWWLCLLYPQCISDIYLTTRWGAAGAEARTQSKIYNSSGTPHVNHRYVACNTSMGGHPPTTSTKKCQVLQMYIQMYTCPISKRELVLTHVYTQMQATEDIFKVSHQ